MPSDRDEVVETCVRLSWHIDHREWKQAAALLVDRVRVDYTSVNGGEPETYGPDEFTAGLSSVLTRLDSTQHVQAGHLVDVDGHRAVCTTNVLGFHRLANPHGAPMRTVGGTYRFELIHTADGWKISDWTFTLSWADGNTGIMAVAEAAR